MTYIGAVIPEETDGLTALLVNRNILVPNNRIVGGSATTIESFPWIVSMQRFGAHRCGASIISANRIITAAHCTIGIQASGLQIRAGSTNSQSGGQVVQVSKIINHHAYNSKTLINDVALIWTSSSLNLTPAGVSAITMHAQSDSLATGSIAQVSGWGKLCEGCASTNSLRFVGVSIMSTDQCNKSYRGVITSGMLCAGFLDGGRDACQGDSGGPLTFGKKLIGIVSWGDGCARPNFPGVYTRVASYRKWIDSNV